MARETASAVQLRDGDVTTPAGFLAGATYAGIKTYGEGKLDLGLLYAERRCAAAAMFTRNRVKGAPVLVSQRHLADGYAQALIANAGCANVATGPDGIVDAEEMASLAAARLGVHASDVVVASTGVIGRRLPMDLIRESLPGIELSRDGGAELARAIMTTDTRPKTACAAFEADGHTYTIGGIAKGSGMIHPDMATMFAIMTADVPVSPGLAQEALRLAVDDTLNMVSVDHDTSTSDMALLLASGVAGGPPLDANAEAAALFRQALFEVCRSLARQIARDGEGASKLIEVVVEGAADRDDARRAARTISASPLVKAAVFGNDPNWGRILMAAGRSGAALDLDRMSVRLGDIPTFDRGRPAPFSEVAASEYLRSEEVRICVNLGVGEAVATAWGCDLSEDYVRINSEYTT